MACSSSAMLLSAQLSRPLSKVPFLYQRGPGIRPLHSPTGGSGAPLRENPQLAHEDLPQQDQQHHHQHHHHQQQQHQQHQHQGRRGKTGGSFSQSLAELASGLRPEHASPVSRARAYRMMLDAIGVGLLGARTEVAQLARRHGELMSRGGACTAWGSGGVQLSASGAAFVNGVSIHAMDFDDTWHPATHPTGSLLPALLAAAEAAPAGHKPSGLRLLLAFLVGVEVQGRLLRCSREANDIPTRFHPPTVVGTIGAAAGCARLLGLDAPRALHALAIAASFAGAPLANAATQAKPLHAGHAARMGLEAAALAASGLRANEAMFDLAERGFGAFYPDYEAPRCPLDPCGGAPLLIEQQDVAFKRFPAHLGTHWVADAALALRERLVALGGESAPLGVESLLLRVPHSAYVDRAFPADEHEARHSFQFVGCSALLDGDVTVASFESPARSRAALRSLLERTRLEHPGDNAPSFALMYAEAEAAVASAGPGCGPGAVSVRCDSFRGHWRRPLGPDELRRKFAGNAAAAGLRDANAAAVVGLVEGLEELQDATEICRLLR